MSERLVKKVAIAVLRGEIGDGGWLKIDAPKATDKEISLAIMEAEDRGLVKARELRHQQSPPYPEWRLVGPTGATERFIRDTRVAKKFWAGAMAVVGVIVAFLKWLIPVVVGLIKK
jgi:hypothetical protein